VKSPDGQIEARFSLTPPASRATRFEVVDSSVGHPVTRDCWQFETLVNPRWGTDVADPAGTQCG